MWECCGSDKTSFASETFPGGAPFKQGTFNLQRYQISPVHQGFDDYWGPYDLWNYVCRILSGKDISVKSDLPIVLSGLARDFARRLLVDDEYVAGLWKLALPHSLLWHTDYMKMSDRGGDGYADDNEEPYVAPSWSWLSQAGFSIRPRSRQDASRGRKFPTTTVSRITTELRFDDDPYGPVKPGAQMEVEGVLRRIQLTFTQGSATSHIAVLDERDDTDRTQEERTYRDIGPTWEAEVGDHAFLYLDRMPEDTTLYCHCLLVSIQPHASYMGSRPINERTIGCLLLQYLGDQSEKDADGEPLPRNRRIGTLHLKDLYASKMRYTFSEDEDEPSDVTWEDAQHFIYTVQNAVHQKEEREKDERQEKLDGQSKKGEKDVKDTAKTASGTSTSETQKDPPMSTAKTDTNEDREASSPEGSSDTLYLDSLATRYGPPQENLDQIQGVEALYQFDVILGTAPSDFGALEELEAMKLLIV
ncbi:Uu.00g027230.m01.CDS01 [Anthostomella pinea]|uniref:Uu.00g027230.m01.CDS01 n=1 Tax=Anthostomella pinea TaxID=933095 RepID=A0AAI8V8P8_9PEZI|nr:Uu.00g027230.m01.CDS01 [Anthostomella pinea]